MYNFYLTNNGNILNTDLWCFQTPDGRYLRPVLHDELTYLANVLIPVEFPEGLEIPDVSNLDKLSLNVSEFESIFRSMDRMDIYEYLTDSDFNFKRSNHKDLETFIGFSDTMDFGIGIDGNIYINLYQYFFCISNGYVYILFYPFNGVVNVEFVKPKEKTKRRSKHSL